VSFVAHGDCTAAVSDGSTRTCWRPPWSGT
jgi:hypothetical protein